jgi:hypothetical protein
MCCDGEVPPPVCDPSTPRTLPWYKRTFPVCGLVSPRPQTVRTGKIGLLLTIQRRVPQSALPGRVHTGGLPPHIGKYSRPQLATHRQFQQFFKQCELSAPTCPFLQVLQAQQQSDREGSPLHGDGWRASLTLCCSIFAYPDFENAYNRLRNAVAEPDTSIWWLSIR